MAPDNIIKDFDEGSRTAMVCEDNQEAQKAIMTALQELKFQVDSAANAEQAFEKLKFNRYDVVVLNEIFSGSSPDDNEFLKHLQYMPMSTRRHICVVLLGQNYTTHDNMAAYDKSVNAVINEKEIANIRSILKRAISDNDQFYKVYKESLVKMGKM